MKTHTMCIQNQAYIVYICPIGKTCMFVSLIRQASLLQSPSQLLVLDFFLTICGVLRMSCRLLPLCRFHMPLFLILPC